TRKRSIGRYLTMSILFACGLMCKPMLITTPVILLLLDYWPLNRFTKSTSSKLVIEKVALFMLSVGSCVATLWAQNFALGSTQFLPLRWRITNALFSYFEYLRQMFWPVDLIPFYVHPENRLELWRLLVAAVVLIALTAIAFIRRRKNPYLIVGWLWYLTMLLPVIGIVQVGLQGHADRYTYLPQIGLCIALTWLIADLLTSFRYRRQILATASTIVIAALSACAWKQISYWRNSESLWTHALAVTSDNETAHTNFGMFLLERGQIDDAISHLETALQILSRSGEAHYNLSQALVHSDLGEAFVDKGSIE